MYDTAQLEKDLKLVLRTFGSLEQVGNYTKRVYEDGAYRVEESLSLPQLMYCGRPVNPSVVGTETEIGQWLMRAAMRAEAVQEELAKRRFRSETGVTVQ